MFEPLAKLVSRYPRWILGAWLLVLLGAFPLANRLSEILTAQAESPANSVAKQVSDILGKNFEAQGELSVVLVTQGRGIRVGEPAFDEAYSKAIESVSALDGVSSIQDYQTTSALPLNADDGSFTVSLLNLASEDRKLARATSARVRELLASVDELSFALAGGPATQLELEQISERDVTRAELFGLPLSLIVLVIAFGALAASVLPIVIALSSITLSFALLFILGQVFEFAVFTQSIVTMLGLATGIDYALLMVNRYREELRKDSDKPRDAAYTSVLTAGKTVAFSGVTVMVALGALLVPPLPFIRSIGLGTMVVMGVSVSVSITALPALLALLGKRINWLKVTRLEPGQRSRKYWAKWAEAVLKRPWPVALAGLIFLLLLSLPALRIQLADPGPRSLSAATEAGQVFEALREIELEGLLKSFDVVIDLGERGFFHPSSVRDVAGVSSAFAELEGVDGTYSPMSAGAIPRLLLYQYYAEQENALNSEVGNLVRRTVSKDGRYALIRVFPASLSPREGAVLTQKLEGTLTDLELEGLVGGSYVREAEWTRVLYRSFPLAVGLVYLATFILLGLAFRSLLIPLKSILLNTLTVSAAFGVITLLYQFGIGHQLFGISDVLGFVDNSAPIFIFAIVFGLSMDYEVFLVARLFEAHEQGMDDRAAIIHALSTTGGVITSAAAIMIIVFSVFIFSEVVLIKTLGIGLGIAILVDASLVRIALVPAFMLLAGRWNWWLPRPLARLAERLNLSHD